jgi:hypothetical protein
MLRNRFILSCCDMKDLRLVFSSSCELNVGDNVLKKEGSW